MKQRITVEQLTDLTDEQRFKLCEWWKPDVGDLYAYEGENGLSEHLWDVISNRNDMVMANEQGYFPLFSIGQMSTFLYDNCNDWGMHYNDSGVFYTVYLSWSMETARLNGRIFVNDELCDALWEAVKVALRDEKK